AEIGRNSGGAINLVIKSGGNDLHGSAYYFNRNEYFAARSPVAPPGAGAPKIRNNQFGFSAGGPVVKNHTFFFLNYEGLAAQFDPVVQHGHAAQHHRRVQPLLERRRQ